MPERLDKAKKRVGILDRRIYKKGLWKKGPECKALNSEIARVCWKCGGKMKKT